MPNATLVVQGLDSPEIIGRTREVTSLDNLKAGGLLPQLVDLGVPAASATTGWLASLAGNSATLAFTISAQPDKPRNIAIAFAASWDGGNVVVTGTDQFGNAVSETIVAVAASTVVGNVAFKTITSAVKTAVGAAAAAATGGPGSKLGIARSLTSTAGLLFVTSVPEASTFNVQFCTALPGTNTPNGTRAYLALVNV
jgi:hypothetical protein